MNVTGRDLGIFGIGAALVAAISLAVPKGPGDEPPIRVKNGSIRIQLMNASGAKWSWGNSTNHQGQKAWQVSKGLRRNELLRVIVVSKLVTDSQYACDRQPLEGQDAVITYSDGNTVTFEGQSKRMEVTSTALLKVDTGDDSLLTYEPVDGYIASISVGGRTCSFKDKDQLDSIFALDW